LVKQQQQQQQQAATASKQQQQQVARQNAWAGIVEERTKTKKNSKRTK
jgi:hypothetical protein